MSKGVFQFFPCLFAVSLIGLSVADDCPKSLKGGVGESEVGVLTLEILRAVESNEPVSGIELREILGWGRRRVASRVHMVAEKGLLRRDRLESDPRQRTYSLTAKGRRALSSKPRSQQVTVGQAVYKLSVNLAMILRVLSGQDEEVLGPDLFELLPTTMGRSSFYFCINRLIEMGLVEARGVTQGERGFFYQLSSKGRRVAKKLGR